MISVEQAIEDLKNGKMLVMVDDVDRENEGDLVFASTFSSAEGKFCDYARSRSAVRGA